MLPEPVGSTPAATNPVYSTLFAQLGWGSVAVGVALVLLIPVLRRLIRDKEAPADDELMPAVAPR
jgi:POT family proton-dependent oligopeptide transporter